MADLNGRRWSRVAGSRPQCRETKRPFCRDLPIDGSRQEPPLGVCPQMPRQNGSLSSSDDA